MFTKPRFAAVALAVALGPFLSLIYVFMNSWWAILASPGALASFGVERAEHLIVERSCWSAPHDWQRLMAMPDAEARFEGAFARATTPEGRLTAVLGLYALKSGYARGTREQARLRDGSARIRALGSDSISRISWDSAGALVASGALASLYMEARVWPEC